MPNILYTKLQNLTSVWLDEFRSVIRDEGVVLFVLVMPFVYPLLYSWIYNNEVLRDAQVAVVDLDHSALSRRFAAMADATAEVEVAYHAASVDEARRLIGQQKIVGFYVLPEDFSRQIMRGGQGHVSVYCDMGLMLNYKAVYQTATAVSSRLGAELQKAAAGNVTDREDELMSRPIEVEEVTIFNPTTGYANFILPGVLILVAQQTLVLGVCMAMATARERNPRRRLLTAAQASRGLLSTVLGKAMCWFMILMVTSAYMTLAVPRFFGLMTLATAARHVAVMTPFLLAVVFFGMSVGAIMRYREHCLLIVVFLSVPLLFLSGVSWPLGNMPWVWRIVGAFLPSTFAIQAYIRENTMGATVADVRPELVALWVQAAAYFAVALLVYARDRRLLCKK